MKYEDNQLNNFRHRLTIEIDPAEVDAEFAHTYSDFAYRFPFEDYASGLAPREVIDATFGADAIAATVGKALCDKGFGYALGEADLVKIGDPAFVPNGLPAMGNSFSFTAEVDCSPCYQLTSYEPITVRLPAMGNNAAMAPALQKIRENEALHILQERLEGEIPEILIDTQEQLQLQEIYAKANAQNMPFEKYLIQQRIDPDQFKIELEQQAEEMVRRNLALDAWARHIGIEITDEQIKTNFVRSGVPYPELEEARWRENGRIAELRQAIRRAGAMRNIMQNLQIETI